MKRRRWIWLVGLAAVIIGGGYLAVRALVNRPLGQALALQTPTRPPATAAAPAAISPAVQATGSAGPTSTAAPTALPATSTAAPALVSGTCGNTGPMRILVIGLTTPTDTEVLGADAIRLVTIDFDRPSATVLSLPAMVWIDPPAGVGIGTEKLALTSVYWKGYTAAQGEPAPARHQKATQAIAQAIVDNFGYVPDHYITVDEEFVIKYVDALGGIEIDLSQAVDATKEGYGVYPAGPQVLDGKRALNFARVFHPGGAGAQDVWGNLGRQNLVVKGILAATLKPQNWTKIPGLMREMLQAVVTDLSLDQTLDLACMVQKVGSDARMQAVDSGMVKMDSQGHMLPDKDAIRRLIAEMDRGD